VVDEWIVYVYLPEDCGLVVDDIPTPKPHPLPPNFASEGQLCPRQYANRNVFIFWGTETERLEVKSAGGKLVADLGRSGFDAL